MNFPKQRTIEVAHRACVACGTLKSPRDFYPTHRKCKSCCVRASSVWKKANPERAREIRKAYCRANAEKEQKRARAWRERNAERHKANNRAWVNANPERSKGIIRAWADANRAKRCSSTRKRYAAKLMAIPTWADMSAIETIYAEASARDGRWHVDHIVPLQGKTVCGLHCEANLEIIPGSENEGKCNRWWPDMFGDAA